MLSLASPSGSILLIPVLVPFYFFVDSAKEKKGCASSTHCIAQFILWFFTGFSNPFCMMWRTWVSSVHILSAGWCEKPATTSGQRKAKLVDGFSTMELFLNVGEGRSGSGMEIWVNFPLN